MNLRKTVITVNNQFFFEELQRFTDQKKNIIIPVKGTSMRPFIQEGEKILLKPFEKTQLSIGSIILGKYKNQMVLHRLIRYDNNHIWLAGDGNVKQIEQIAHKDIIATAYILYRNEKQITLRNTSYRWIGYIWFLLRPLRRAYTKLYKLIRN